MRVAFSSSGDNGLNAELSQHFGRCPFFIVVELDDDGEIIKIESYENPYFNQHVQGAVPRFVESLNVDVIIAGGMGPRAANLFMEMGIKPFTTRARTVGEALSYFLKGELGGVEPCSHGGHYH